MANKNIRSLSYRKELQDNLFENIVELAKKPASQEEFHELAERFMIDDSVVLGTASFYDFLKPENQNKIVHVCNGTACLVAGTQKKLSNHLENLIDPETIGHAPCLGHCHHNNAFMYDDKTYSTNAPEVLKDIIKKVRDRELAGINVTLPFKQKIINQTDKIINDAEITGSVNTLLRDEDGFIVGENTDVFGLQAAYLKEIENDLNKKSLVIGAGGVSPSVILSLQKSGIKNISITNRTNEKCIFLKKKFKFLNM